MNAPDRAFLATAAIHPPVEAQSRLIQIVCATLGVGRMATRHRKTVLQNIAAGLRHSEKTHAQAWAAHFTELAQLPDEAWPADKGSHHGLAQVILRQPLPARSSEAKRRCLAI